ncbi:MAG TPA: sigma-70 family RNA polymerase sigma factor [Terriglobales bacterium]|nr:sigma-70 family RNA polymerase sigma factor [Terriglobales bacterium]
MEAVLSAAIDRGLMGSRAAGGLEPVSLERAFLEHKERVFRAAYRVTGSASDAEDVVQSVFLKLARREMDLGNDIQNLGSYLHRAAVNAALDVIRMRRDAQHMALDDAEITHPQELSSRDEGEYSPIELRRWLRQAMTKLGTRSAEMFVLRYIEGRDNREIAKMLKTTRATVAVTLHRTRSLLKNDFRAYMEGTR